MEEIKQICRKCNKEKVITEFVKDNRRKIGYSTLCKECKKLESNTRYNIIKDDPEFHRKKLESNKKYKTENKEKIKDAWTIYNNKPEVVERKQEWAIKNQHLSVNHYLKIKVNGAKRRAIEKNIPFDIIYTDINILEYCPILGIKLNWCGGPRDKDTPSLDRIIPELGYVKGNICIISNLANMMKSEALYNELEKFSNNIMKYMKNEEIVRPIENGKSIELEDKELLR
jgi:hypothetical protein